MINIFRLAPAGMVYAITKPAFAHGGLSLNDTDGNGLLWVYAIVLGAIVGVIFYRIYRRSTQPEGYEQIGRRMADLENALASNLAALRNAEDYPAQYGLSPEEKRKRLDAVATIRQLIKQEELSLEAAREDAQSVAT